MSCCVWSNWNLDCQDEPLVKFIGNDPLSMMLFGGYIGILFSMCILIVNLASLFEKQAVIDKLREQQKKKIGENDGRHIKRSKSMNDNSCCDKMGFFDYNTRSVLESDSGYSSSSSNEDSQDKESCDNNNNKEDSSVDSKLDNPSRKKSDSSSSVKSEQWEEWTPEWDNEF